MIPPPTPEPELITRDALNRIEARANERVAAVKELLEARLDETDRRLADLNNSHDKATQEKKRTDEAAVQVQERTVSRLEFQAWKDEVNRALNLAQGAATARATMMSVAVGIAVLVINLVIRYMTP